MHAAGLWDPRSVWAGCTDRLLLGIVTAVGRRGPLLFGVLWRASTGSWLSSFPSAAVVPSPRRQPQPLQFSYTTGVVALALGMGAGGWGHCVVLLRAAAPTTMFSSSSFAGASCLCLPLGGRRCGAWLLGASPLRGRWGGGCSELHPSPFKTLSAYVLCCRYLGVSLHFPSLWLSSRLRRSAVWCGLGGLSQKLCLAYASADNDCAIFRNLPCCGVVAASKSLWFAR